MYDLVRCLTTLVYYTVIGISVAKNWKFEICSVTISFKGHWTLFGLLDFLIDALYKLLLGDVMNLLFAMYYICLHAFWCLGFDAIWFVWIRREVVWCLDVTAVRFKHVERVLWFVVENEVSPLVLEDWVCICFGWGFYGGVHDQNWLLYDKVTVLESEKRAWENSTDAQAIREALNPWRHFDAEETKKS
ncbi:hypothetical protein V8G54_029091 [Vigna mungo]|uniref:Transmembrane protein n=1 Tax=Vigna mungo TaxID=3915 RepID=A0AAQ3RMA6_VIGMU